MGLNPDGNQGKPIVEARGEVTYGLSFFEWFSEEARRINGDVVSAPTNNKQLVFIREPIGVAAMITPWNFPNAMITRKVRFEIKSERNSQEMMSEPTQIYIDFLR